MSRLLAVLAVTIALVAGCGTSGRTMHAPEPGATAPPRKPDASTTTTVLGQGPVINSTLFTLTSPNFSPGEDLPASATCDGAGVRPQLAWANIPAGTVELAVSLTDPDAGGFVHWVVVGIDPAQAGIDPGALPSGALELRTTDGLTDYSPPCPPDGETHTYDFTLYALSAKSAFTAASDTQQALITMSTDAKAVAVLTASYTRTSAN
jgi:Raf kinase inhibitor-like YbhB/YbcL family protein